MSTSLLRGFFAYVILFSALIAAAPRHFDYVVPLQGPQNLDAQLHCLGSRLLHYGPAWITSNTIISLGNLMENNFDGFLDVNNFTPVYAPEGNYSRDARYGLTIAREDFFMPADLYAFQKRILFKRATEGLEERIRRFKETLAAAETHNKSVLFMRYQAIKEEAQLFTASLKKRYPALNFALLIVESTDDAQECWGDPAILLRSISHKELQSPDGWKKLLASVVDFSHTIRPTPQAFGAVIPLGLKCHTTHQLIRLGLRRTNYGFEWCVSKPHSLAQLILHDFEGFLEKDNFSFVPPEQKPVHGPHMLDKRYGLMLVHDFSLPPGLSGSEREALKTQEFIGVHQKLGRRIARFTETLQKAEISGDPILFVRHKETTPDEAQLLVSAISTRYPRLDFTFLVLDGTEEIKMDWGIPRVINRFIEDGNDNWMPLLNELVNFSKQTLGSTDLHPGTCY